MARRPMPPGLWPSPIAARDVAIGARRFGMVQGGGAWIYWTEGRPEEKGRQAIMRARPGGRGRPEDVLAAPFSARSRVHEYGGGELLVADERLFFVNDADQDVYELAPGGEPRRITREPAVRFADLCLDRRRDRLIGVGERHAKGMAQPANMLVAIPLSGPRAGRLTTLAEGRDFYACPRLSPDGERLAFVAWDLPGMPWDEAELLVARLSDDGNVAATAIVAGGGGVAASYPAWLADGRLVYLSDASGFGAFSVHDGDRSRAIGPRNLEFGRPPWVFGSAPYAIDRDGIIWAAPISKSGEGAQLMAIDPDARGGGIAHDIPDSLVDCVVGFDGGIAGLAANRRAAGTVSAYRDGSLGAPVRLRTASDVKLDAGDVSVPERIQFTGGDGERTFAFYYPPTNRRVRGEVGDLPPAIVMAHGGPTASAASGLNLRTQFYTSRGIAVLDVDYAGSTGYGRAYRERLDGQWGIADVADCAAAARVLARKKLADPQRIAIAGGSAGGYTVLMALATTDVFAAGSSHYGISDLTLLMAHTHKFEAGYLHRLLGTTEKAWKRVCRERSPLTHIAGIAAPLILFQGLEDKVVPPEQSRLIHERLKARGIPTELHEFAGEGHGFRRADTIVAALEAELAFLVKAMRIGAA